MSATDIRLTYVPFFFFCENAVVFSSATFSLLSLFPSSKTCYDRKFQGEMTIQGVEFRCQTMRLDGQARGA